MRYLVARYALWELLKVFSVSLTVLTLLIVLVGVAQEAIRQNLGLGPILRLLPYILPDALRFSLPATILFSACSVFGRMSADNEVLAIKSLGVSPMVVVWPALGLAFALSLTAVWINDLRASWGDAGVRRVVVQSVEQIAYGMLRSQRSYSNKRFSISVRRVEGRQLISPTVTFFATPQTPTVTLKAQQAELRAVPEDNQLTITLTNGTINVGDQLSVFFPDTIQRIMPLADASRKGAHSLGASNCALWRIPAEIVRQRGEIHRLQQSLAAQAALEMVTGEFESLTGDEWTGRHKQLADSRYRLHRLQSEPWRRWASGFSCFFFVLAGIPLAIRLRNADVTTSFILCFLPILVVYYPLMAYGAGQAKAGTLPPYAVWLGNAICLVAGLLLLRKVLRY